MNFLWSKCPDVTGAYDLYVDGERLGISFWCRQRAGGWAGVAGGQHIYADTEQEAKVWVESQYLLREDL
jgi:hypothetical protein